MVECLRQLLENMPTAYNFNPRTQGFTLIESMTVLAIMGILASLALPSFRSFLTKTRIESQVSELTTDFLYARSEAATRSKWITICPSADGSTCSTASTDWIKGSIIFVDTDQDGNRQSTELLIRARSITPSSSLSVTVTGFTNTTSLTYNPYGSLLPLGNQGAFKLCDSTSSSGKTVTLNVNGSPIVSKVSCP